MIERLTQQVWLVPFLPLVAAIATAVFGKALRRAAALPAIFGIGAAAIISAGLLVDYPFDEEHALVTVVASPWLDFANLSVPIEFRLDSLSTMMIAMVTFVATLIAIFAAGYMADDDAQPRFFAIVSLFVAAMTGLVLSNNFVLTYACWEGVGVCSYLLVGHYYYKHSAAAASQKAFLMNRIGDVGFALAIFLIWQSFGHSVRYNDVLDAQALAKVDHGTLLAIGALLFWAATAKSAQIPLYTWLPDAMEGPTPVSALIHAATMVTAGVYLVARCSLLFAQSPGLQVLITITGALTALIAAFIALTQYDLKRVLAYSTVSQLGFMFMALGAGVGHVARFAVIAAMFHLVTHAFFKALLFLGSGSVMHSMGNVIDMRRFGGLGKRMPITCLTFAVGALALAAAPMTSGFYSKDEILVTLREAAQVSPDYGWIYGSVYWLALFTAFLTAFYITRAFCMTFLGPDKLPSPKDPEADPAEAHGHGHGHGHGHHKIGEESAWIMLVPLAILAVFALGAGFALGPNHAISHYLETTPGLHDLGHAEGDFSDSLTAMLSFFVAAGGIISAYVIYGTGQPSRAHQSFMKMIQPLSRLASRKFLVDEFYQGAVVTPTRVFAKILMLLEVLLFEPLMQGIAALPRVFGRAALARYQNGLVQSYAAASTLTVVLLLIVLLFLR